MTNAELGRMVKMTYPQYAEIPDAKLGAAMKARFPGIYDDDADQDSNTLPETPRTLAIQLEQLQDGLRRVVFIARGSKVKVDPKQFGARKLVLPPGEFVYAPKAIKPREIKEAVENHELASILGSTDMGYGAPNKDELQGDPMAVVARDEDGETAHSALTDAENADESLAAAETLMPEGGSVTLESPEIEMENRMAAMDRPEAGSAAMPLKFKRPGGRGGKWPKPGAR